MTDFIVNIVKHLRKLSDELSSSPRRCAEIDKNGFRLGNKWILFGKTILSRRFKKHYWRNVKEINVYTGDILNGIDIILNNGKRIVVHDHDMNWDRFVAELPRQFPGFNMHNFKEINNIVEGVLPCWNSQEKIDNLRVDSQKNAVVWEADGSIYYKFE